ncbi:hypothetical protein PV08_11643 [Exophiala spinifera]|uniref:Zn(2)-C6 fungal-type domain-containing protein n=1 Tax=Exophiala spinifera TaxID=91928 RepID=A0A0D2BH48_9EURO|nr:uncharacterized protein PV08_11643 [Exophiala spinifera]KIW10679.1 hypothetical protein PV08_11643 [Exophiala spinifera]
MSASLSYSRRTSSTSTDLHKFRRTNSLAFAKSDCHTCSSLNVRCDRQRPRCTPCLDAGILCQGYSMKLTWHQSHSMVNKPPKVKSATAKGPINRATTTGVQKNHEKETHDLTNADGKGRTFMFVAARPSKRRKRSHQHQSTTTNSEYASSSLRVQSVVAAGTSNGASMGDQSDSAKGEMSPALLPDLSQSLEQAPAATADILQLPLPSPPAIPDLEGGLDPSSMLSWHQQDLDWISPPCQQTTADLDLESLEQCLEIQRQPLPLVDPPSPNFSADLNLLDLSQTLWQDEDEDLDGHFTPESSSTRLSLTSDRVGQEMSVTVPQMLYSTLTEKFYGLLDMYDREFCWYPITNDFSVNPYRLRPETTRGSQHLLHAIVALSCHFKLRSPNQLLPPSDAIDHKNTSLVLYQNALSKEDAHIDGLSLLDTAMALWQFEAALSSLNIWRTHLGDAYKLLELCGGIRRWSAGIKANTQVAMFLWWDAMVSLLSREQTVFPYSYFEALLKAEGRQPWTFYELNGCPREVLVPMMQLANLAASSSTKQQNRIATADAKVSSRIVAEIELSLRRYEYHGDGLSDLVFEGMDFDEEALHIERDRYHCCEAFRYALLIYIVRIFVLPNTRTVERKKGVHARLSFLSRVVLEHVHACRPSGRMIQKQALFPVFMAGVEIRAHQGHENRQFVAEYCERWYGKFGYQMYSTVLDVCRAVWAERDAGNEEYWWGEELDSRRAMEGAFVQFCFG